MKLSNFSMGRIMIRLVMFFLFLAIVVLLYYRFFAYVHSTQADANSSQQNDGDALEFADTNFKLAVISSLIESKQLKLGSYKKFLKKIDNPGYDYEEDGYDLSVKAYEYFKSYPLYQTDIEGVEKLTFDGGNEIYPYIYPFWGGETDDFDISSLDDLKYLPNLRKLQIISMLMDSNLEPLTGNSKLEEINLSLIEGNWVNLEVLLELPKLKLLTIFDSNFDPATHAHIFESLKSKNVTVKVY